MKAMSHKAVTVFRITNSIVTVLLLALSAAVIIVKQWWFTFIPWWIIAIMALLTILQFCWFVIIEPVLAHRYFRYEIKNDEVIVRRGIFIHRTNVIPFVRIQNITTSVGPIMKQFGLKSVVITTAGGSETIELVEDVEALLIKTHIDEAVSALERRMYDYRDRDRCD